MRVLVTGSAGFIGSNVTEQLLEQGHDVVGIDNVNDAYDPRLKEWRIEHLEKRNFKTVRLDVTDRDGLDKLFVTHSFDAVINLAARAGVRDSLINPWVYMETNVTGTLNLLEQCRRRGVSKFVLASTSSLYGADNEMPFRETSDTNRPLSPYAAFKKAAEALCHSYHHIYGIDVTVFRYFTVYGPGGRPDMSIFRFVQWISEGRPVTLYGDGSQERDFTFVEDIARGTIAGLRPMKYEVINLGSDRPAKLMDVVHNIENLLENKANLKFEPAHPADAKATWADVTRARTLLGWEPRTHIERGLQRSVEWYRQNRSWASQVRTG